MTGTKRAPLARQTGIVHDGLTVTTWGDERYGFLHLLGTVGEEGSVTIVDITFTTVKAKEGAPSTIDIIAKAVARLMEASLSNAHATLEDAEALVTAAERVRYLMDEGEEQMKTAAWTIAWNDAAEALRTALDKFTVREGQQPRAEEPDTYEVRPTYPPAWYEDTQ